MCVFVLDLVAIEMDITGSGTTATIWVPQSTFFEALDKTLLLIYIKLSILDNNLNYPCHDTLVFPLQY